MIPSAHGNMTGLYTCVAGNEAGIDEYSVLLLVTSCDHQANEVKYHTKGKLRNSEFKRKKDVC